MIERTIQKSDGTVHRWKCPNKCSCNKITVANGHVVQFISDCERNPTIKCAEIEI